MIKCTFEIKGIKYIVETETAEVLGEVIGAIHEVSSPKIGIDWGIGESTYNQLFKNKE